MGVNKRWIWMVVLSVFCMVFGGCKEVEKPKTQVVESEAPATKAPTEKPQVTAKPATEGTIEETEPSVAPIPEAATEQPPVTVLPATEKPTELPQETILPVTEEMIEEPETFVAPVSEAATKQPPVTEAPPTEAPTEPPQVTEVPIMNPPTTQLQATAAPHVHDTTVEVREATCLEAGLQKEYCKSCGEGLREEAVSAALGHDFAKSVWELPTCQKGGYYNNICNRCGLVECVTQNPLPHEVEDIVVQEGNCMEDTIIRHICKDCGLQVESDTRNTVYDSHNWLTEIIDGKELTYCEWCGVAK